jgi:hypothetical protein
MVKGVPGRVNSEKNVLNPESTVEARKVKSIGLE